MRSALLRSAADRFSHAIARFCARARSFGPAAPWVLVCLIVALPPFCANPSEARSLRAERGTLVVVVRWRLGIVVCADRRRLIDGDPNVAYRDDVLKIIPAPPFGLAVTYGTTVYGRQGGPRFDAQESVKRFAADLGGSSLVRGADRLATQLQTEMAESLEQGSLPPPQPRPGEPAVFAVMLFALEQGTVLEALLLGVNSETGFQVQPSLRPSNQFVTLLGHSAVAFAIRGSDPRFQDLRNDPWLGGFLINPSPQAIAYVSKHDTMQFGRKLIRATSERLPSLQETADVSADSDCAGLTRPDGFEWLPDVP
jgi:hypothetical protein